MQDSQSHFDRESTLRKLRRGKIGEIRAKWGRNCDLSNFMRMPDPECVSPRDGKKLLESTDSMFLAVMLCRSAKCKQIVETKTEQGGYCYYPEIGDCAGTLTERKMIILKRINRSTLGDHFITTFLDFRSQISGRNTACYLFIEGKKIRASCTLGSKALLKIGSSLERPFTKKEDIIIERFHEVTLFDWLKGEAPTLCFGEVYCPIDGPVTPIQGTQQAHHSSSEIYLCPKCLGNFGIWMRSIS